MKYQKIQNGTFLSRPNRFIAYVKVNGKEEICHVKNTGRCKELLVEGATVYLEESQNPVRKTKYDLIAVQKGERLINLDSQAPNQAFWEWAPSFFQNLTHIRREKTFGKSRFDCYAETADGRKCFIEVKGVTLEQDGVVLFPDAPTQRGVKHVEELCECVKSGYDAYLFFVIQMKDVAYFTPNRDTHPEFADALQKAVKEGVKVYAVDCDITPDSMEIRDFVEVKQ